MHAGRGLAVAASLLLLSTLGGCAGPSLAELDADDPEDRRDAVRELARRSVERDDQKELRPAVAERARKLARSDPNPAVRAAAIRALARLVLAGVQPREGTQVLAEQVGVSRDEFVRIDAATTLAEVCAGVTGDEAFKKWVREESVDALKKALRIDSDRDVRIVCARELGNLRAAEAKAELVGALRDETPDVRYHAQRALVTIAGEDKGATPEEWERWLKLEAGR